MYALGRTAKRRPINIWPGFVDGLASLLLVVIFVLMVFMIAQYFLSVALSGRDEALLRLNREVSTLAELLSLERAANAELRINVAQMSSELQASLAAREGLSSQLSDLSEERETLMAQIAVLMSERDNLSGRVDELDAEKISLAAQLAALSERTAESEEEAARVAAELATAYQAIDADKEKIEVMIAEIAILKSLRDEVTAQLLVAEQTLNEQRELTEDQRAKLAAVVAKSEDQEERLKRLRTRLSLSEETAATQTELSEEAQRKVDLLNRQIASLREQLARLNEVLEATEAKNKDQQVQIADLGKRLNVALASKVQELARYRSEFFGRLREVLGDHPDIHIEGDRFVFQSEILFESGSAELGEAGKTQMGHLARTLIELSREIPAEIDWVLRVDGHTDTRPIRTPLFPSNWELSTARAISVVKFLISQGLSPQRLAATGFGEFQPIDSREDEIAFRRNRRIELKLTQR
jgi:chemotaxis protein MotB